MAGSTSGVFFTKNGDDVDMVFLRGKKINFDVVWPNPITGYKARLRAMRSSDSTPLLEMTVDNSIIEVDTALKTFHHRMTSSQSAAIQAFEGVWVYDLIDDQDEPQQIFSGKFKAV